MEKIYTYDYIIQNIASRQTRRQGFTQVIPGNTCKEVKIKKEEMEATQTCYKSLTTMGNWSSVVLRNSGTEETVPENYPPEARGSLSVF